MTFLAADRVDRDGMPAPGSVGEGLHETFAAALLLTGSAQRAEFVVTEAIRTLNSDQISAAALFQMTIRIAVTEAVMGEVERSEEREQPASWLPSELQRVCILPRNDRQAFVLLMLLGLRRSRCCQLLQLEDDKLDEHTLCAVLALSSIESSGELR